MPKVSMPRCEFCDTTDDVRKCGICEQWSCFECWHNVGEDTCIHSVTPLYDSNNDWSVDGAKFYSYEDLFKSK